MRQFVLFSSISGLLGSRWLGHYAATSNFLDTFAYARRAIGLPATVVNWGLWKSLDDTQSDEQRQVTSVSGLEPMADEVAIRALWSAMGPTRRFGRRSSPRIGPDWPPPIARGDRFASWTTCSPPTTPPQQCPEASSARPCAKCQPEQRRDLLIDHVGALAAGVMGLAPSEMVDRSAGFFQLGMDSLMSVTLQRALSQSLGEALPPSVVFDYPTVEALADYLATILPELIEDADQKVVDVYDGLTDAELLRQLSERLS